MMISVHIPKTAGTTFRDILARHFGERLLLDYADRPLASGSHWRRLKQRWAPPDDLCGIEDRYDCVHGHFVADKYAALDRPARLITWLRDPVQRTISHYRYWKREPDLRNADCRRLIEHSLSLEAFAALPRMRNVMSRFFGDRTPRDFYFIGTVESFDESLQRFRRLTGIAVDAATLRNAGDETVMGDEPSAAAIRAVEHLNRRDRALYDVVRGMLAR